MCGKFTRMASWAEVVEYANLIRPGQTSDTRPDGTQIVTPAGQVAVVHLGSKGQRLTAPMVWGFTDRAAQGRRSIRHMHARGETVDMLPTWADAFRFRRGVVWADSFNEGEEVALRNAMGAATSRTRTQQWTLQRRDGRPIILGVVFDSFDVGRGLEHEFAQVTTAANAMIAQITDRMPLVLDEADIEIWLGETRAPLDDVKAMARVQEFSDADWEMFPATPAGRTRREGRAGQSDLFG